MKSGGYKALTEEDVNRLIVEVLASDYDPTIRRDLLAILGRWKAGKFELAAEDHNYVWKMLGGTLVRLKGFMLKESQPGPGGSGLYQWPTA